MARASEGASSSGSVNEAKAKHLRLWEYGLRGAGKDRPRLYRKGHHTLTDQDGDQSVELVDRGRI